MPGKGHSQSEETKKKISEALKKNQTQVTTARSPIARQLQREYMGSKQRTEALKAEMRALLASRPVGKNGKAARGSTKALKSKLAVIVANLKNEALARKAIAEQAKAERRIKQANLVIQKSALRSIKFEGMRDSIMERIKKAKTPEAKERFRIALQRVKDNLLHQKEIVKSAKSVVSSKGRAPKPKAGGMFNFSDLFGAENLEEKEYKPWRELTPQEERANLQFLNEQYNKIEDELENGLLDEIMAQVDTTADKAEKAIENDDIKATEAITFGGLVTILALLNNASKQAYAVGKKTAAREVGVPEPATNKQNNQLRAAENQEVASSFAQEMENTARTASRNAIVGGATAGVAVVAVKSALTKTAGKFIQGAVGVLPGQYINRGRKQVFYDNIQEITHFQRSEVLDERTCNICLSLDSRVVKADDPFAHLEVVHSFCRGTWVPVFTMDEQPKESAVGLPKSIRDSFSTIDGRPVVNDFKQLKKPSNNKNAPDAQEEIKKRLEK